MAGDDHSGGLKRSKLTKFSRNSTKTAAQTTKIDRAERKNLVFHLRNSDYFSYLISAFWIFTYLPIFIARISNFLNMANFIPGLGIFSDMKIFSGAFRIFETWDSYSGNLGYRSRGSGFLKIW